MRKFVLIGTGVRSSMYLESLAGNFKDVGEIAAICDTNQTRMDYWADFLHSKYGLPQLPTYKAADFDRMIAEIKPDTVIVTTVDRTHHKYICRAMELGCDVITEKPMTVDAAKCQQIIDTVKSTGKHLTVTFNYRYSPRNTKIKELLKGSDTAAIKAATDAFEQKLMKLGEAIYKQQQEAAAAAGAAGANPGAAPQSDNNTKKDDGNVVDAEVVD